MSDGVNLGGGKKDCEGCGGHYDSSIYIRCPHCAEIDAMPLESTPTGVRSNELLDGPFVVVQYAPWDGGVESISDEFEDGRDAEAYVTAMNATYPNCKHKLFRTG